jgi:hypothetical protein
VARTVVLVVVAAVLGVFIVRQIPKSTTQGVATTPSGTNKPTGKTTTSIAPAVTTTLTPTTTTVSLVGVKVLVLNGSGVAGSAGKWATALTANGITSTPGNAKKADYKTSAMYFVQGFDKQAEAIHLKVPSLTVSGLVPTGVDAPIDDLGGASIIVLLGQDLAATAPFGTGVTGPTTTLSAVPSSRPAIPTTAKPKTTTTVKK